MTFYNVMAVGLGGFFGSILRYVSVRTINEFMPKNFAYGTFSVNIVGSLLLGILVGVALKRTELSENVRLFIGVGICGGFTTFSAFAVENVNLINDKQLGNALLYILGSVILGILAVFAGIWIGRSL